jgi:hypothetical protein
MTIDELYDHMRAMGYDHLLRRTARGIGLLDCELERHEGRVRICDTERGRVIDVWLETEDEAEACARFLELAANWSLYLTASADEDMIARQQAALEAAGIAARRNDIPNVNGPGDARYRIFVGGSDLKRAKGVVES